MPSTQAISLFFQLTLCLGLMVSFADVKSVFCQSNPLVRSQGKLYVEIYHGLGLSIKQLIELLVPVYGLEMPPSDGMKRWLDIYWS